LACKIEAPQVSVNSPSGTVMSLIFATVYRSRSKLVPPE
jgi:hypothetical protein